MVAGASQRVPGGGRPERLARAGRGAGGGREAACLPRLCWWRPAHCGGTRAQCASALRAEPARGQRGPVGARGGGRTVDSSRQGRAEGACPICFRSRRKKGIVIVPGERRARPAVAPRIGDWILGEQAVRGPAVRESSLWRWLL